jgi:hypothetical protein
MKEPRSALAGVAWAVFFGLLSFGSAASSATTFAHIEVVEGIVTIIDDKGQSRIPHVGDTVEEGDTISTGGDGELQMLTEDEGFIAVRPNTKMKIEAYRAKGDAEDTSVISLLSGTFRSITGWIGTFNRDNYKIKTPTAMIAIRGTDHEPFYIPESGPGERPVAAPGTYDKVNSGSTAIRNTAGEVVVNPKAVGFAPHDAKSAPQISKAIPHFYRPSANERRIEQRKPEVEKVVAHPRVEKQNRQPPKESPKRQEKRSNPPPHHEHRSPPARSHFLLRHAAVPVHHIPRRAPVPVH